MKQSTAIDIMLSGKNVFLTGAPGAGKTYTLNQFIDKAEAMGKVVAITASTGIAASHINGLTIHSWAGIGIAEELWPEEVEKMVRNGRIRKRYRDADVLVIDEISMLHGYRLDLVNMVAKRMRNSQEPFGGLQVILVGDLFQLPPVSRDTDVYHFAHKSVSWTELNLTICYITEQHRQEGDDLLIDLLQAMRHNTVNSEHKQLLSNRTGVEGDSMTRLFSHNVDVDTINREHLDALPGKVKTFKMRTGGDNYKVTSLVRNILAPEILELKVDAEVMFVANNFEKGFVNGTRGKVMKFDKEGNPVVKLQNGRRIHVEEHRWTVKENDEIVAEANQLPLRLAWAITIHKSQGMSLDSALIDLSKAFTPGMGYVALSRVRSLAGLYLIGINEMAFSMHQEIYDFDNELLKLSEEAR